MITTGYALSSEEHPPSDLVRFACQAEETGFAFAMISDHFHPWTPDQGNSPFVWAVLGAIANATSELHLGTGVTCPIIRVHPAIIAHASATIAEMAPGRFTLGLGTGENLNEHVAGDRWPSASERLEMLREAISVIRELWTGELVTHRGQHYAVDRAQLFTRPELPPPIAIAASGTNAAELAGENDGLIALGPNRDILSAFEDGGGRDKPRYGMIHVCIADTEEEGRELVVKQWPNGLMTGSMHTDLVMPQDFQEAARLARPEDVKTVVCGPDPDPILETIRVHARAGFDHLYFHQVGPDQERFFRLFEREILPEVAKIRVDGSRLDGMVKDTFPASDPIATWAGTSS